jgi:hypothetical protein
MVFFVDFDQLLRFFDGAFHIERKAGVGFRGNATRNDFQHLAPEFHQEASDDIVNLRRSG